MRSATADSPTSASSGRKWSPRVMPRSHATTWMLLSLACLLAGCGGGGGGSPQEPPQAPANPPPPPPPPPPGPTGGLDSRPSHAACIAPERNTGSVTIGIEPVFPKLKFVDPVTKVSRNPVLLLQAPRDSSRWYVLERP